MKQETTTKGKVVDVLPNTQFKVELGDGKIIRAYLGGRMKLNSIKVMLGDSVEMVVPTSGEIYRVVKRL